MNMYKSLLNSLIYILLISLFLASCSVSKTLKNGGKSEIVEIFYTDKYGKKITKYGDDSSTKKYVYLVIVTKNSIGREVTMEINSPYPDEIGFIYKRKYINNKVSFKIRKNNQKLKLYIYNYKNKHHKHLKEKAERNRKQVK